MKKILDIFCSSICNLKLTAIFYKQLFPLIFQFHHAEICKIHPTFQNSFLIKCQLYWLLALYWLTTLLPYLGIVEERKPEWIVNNKLLKYFLLWNLFFFLSIKAFSVFCCSALRWLVYCFSPCSTTHNVHYLVSGSYVVR